MLVLITYDVSTIDKAGKKRLCKVAKICVNYGQRVQNSVFECMLDPGQLTLVKAKILDIINPAEDSLRIYNLGDHYRKRIEHYGCKQTYDPQEVMIL